MCLAIADYAFYDRQHITSIGFVCSSLRLNDVMLLSL